MRTHLAGSAARLVGEAAGLADPPDPTDPSGAYQ